MTTPIQQPMVPVVAPPEPDLFDGIMVLLRRWYITVPVLIVTGLLAYHVHQAAQPTYEQSTTIGLASPSVVKSQAVQNNGRTVIQSNALAQNGDTTLLANLVSVSLRESSISKQVEATAPSAESSITVLQSNTQGSSNLPAIQLLVTADSAREASAGLSTLQSLASSIATRIQVDAGVPNSRIATSFLLTNDQQARRVEPDQTRATAAVALAGVVLAGVLAVVIDAIIVRVRRGVGSRRSRRRQPA